MKMHIAVAVVKNNKHNHVFRIYTFTCMPMTSPGILGPSSEQPKRYNLWSCQKVCDALHYLLDNILIRFGSKLYRQIVSIPMGTNVADLFLFCYERDFMLSLSDNKQADVVEAFNYTS